MKGWAGKHHLDGEPEAVEAVIAGKLSASDFFFEYCDGKLVGDTLNDAGNTFAQRSCGNAMVCT